VLARTALAALAWLLPVGVVFALRARDDRSPWEIAGDLPLAVAGDLLLVLLLSRFMILEIAALVSRALWIAILVGGIVWRRRPGEQFAWPQALGRRAALQAGALALLGLGLSLTLSRPCAIWDREWHIPLVSSLRGQTLPFMNVHEPTGGLYYHFTGDVLAAMLQAFSGDVLHASLALSLAHDLLFTLLGAQIGLVLWAAGLGRPALTALVAGATLLAGPATLLRGPAHALESGYSIVNLLSLSFRPHASLAYLFTIGVLTFVLARLHRAPDPVRPARLWPSLALSVAALALTDEASLALLGAGLVALWLLEPATLGPSRRAGALALVSLAAVTAITLLLFVGAVGRHAPRYPIALLAPRAPGFLNPPVSLSAPGGLGLVGSDLWQILLVGVAGLTLFACGDRPLRLSVCFYGVILAFAGLAFCCTEMDHAPAENHRWVTAPFAIAPILAASWLFGRRPAAPRGRLPGAAAALLVLLACGFGAGSTVAWLASGAAVRTCRRQQGFAGFASDHFYDLDCRAWAGARLGERARVSYVEPAAAYLYTGCRPTYVSGPAVSPHAVKVGRLQFGIAALEDIQRNMLPAPAALPVACLAAARSDDVLCPVAASVGRCAAQGSAFRVCEAAGPARKRLLQGQSGRR
jgi:hypothetical protein